MKDIASSHQRVDRPLVQPRRIVCLLCMFLVGVCGDTIAQLRIPARVTAPATDPYGSVGIISMFRVTGAGVLTLEFTASGSVVNDKRTALTAAQVVCDTAGHFRDLSKMFWKSGWNESSAPGGGVPVRCAWIFTGSSGYAAALANGPAQSYQKDVAVIMSYGSDLAASSMDYQTYPNQQPTPYTSNPNVLKRLVGYPQHAGDYFMYESSAIDDVFVEPRTGSPSLWQLVTQDSWNAPGLPSLVSAKGMHGGPLLVTVNGRQLVAGVLVSTSDAPLSAYSTLPQPGGPGRPGIRLIDDDVVNSLLLPASRAASASLTVSRVSAGAARNEHPEGITEIIWPTPGQQYDATISLSPPDVFSNTSTALYSTHFKVVNAPSWLLFSVGNQAPDTNPEKAVAAAPQELKLIGQPPLPGEQDIEVYAWDASIVSEAAPGWTPSTGNYGPPTTGYALVKRIHLTFGKSASAPGKVPVGTAYFTRKDLWDKDKTNVLYAKYDYIQPVVRSGASLGHAWVLDTISPVQTIPIAPSIGGQFPFVRASQTITRNTNTRFTPPPVTVYTIDPTRPTTGTVLQPITTYPSNGDVASLDFVPYKITGFAPPYISPGIERQSEYKIDVPDNNTLLDFLRLAYLGSDLAGVEIVGPDRIRIPNAGEESPVIKFQVRLRYRDGQSRLVSPDLLQDGTLTWNYRANINDIPNGNPSSSFVTLPPNGRILDRGSAFGDFRHSRAGSTVPQPFYLGVTYEDGTGTQATAIKQITWVGPNVRNNQGSVIGGSLMVGGLQTNDLQIGAAGGSINVSFTASDLWTANPADDSPWITVTSGTSGAGGPGAVALQVASNPNPFPRTGRVYIGDQVFRVDQGFDYSPPIFSPVQVNVGISAGTGQVAVSAGASVGWSVYSLDSWIAVTSATDNVGPATVNFSYAALPAGLAARSGYLSIAGQTYTVIQSTSGVVRPPNVSPPSPISPILEDGSLTFAFTVSVGQNSASTVGQLQFGAVPLDPNNLLVPGGAAPSAYLATGGSGSTRTLTVTPAANRSGSSVVVVTVTDPGAALSTTYDLTVSVTPVNDAPTIAVIGSTTRTTPGGTPASPPPALVVPFQLTDIDTPISNLSVSQTAPSSSNPAILPVSAGNLGVRDANGNFNLTLTPVANQSSPTPVRVTVYVSDGEFTSSAYVDVTVTASPPVITSAAGASGTVGVPFNYQITATNGPTSYSASGLPPGLTLNTSSGLLSGSPTVAGDYSPVIYATNNFGTGSETMNIVVQAVTLKTALDTVQVPNDFDWETIGDFEGDYFTDETAVWLPQVLTTHDGTDAAQSPPLTDNGYSALNSTVSGPGTLTFWWKVSSEQSYDYLKLFVDVDPLYFVYGPYYQIFEFQPTAQITGEQDWAQMSVHLTAGTHDLAWVYDKDVSFSEGVDAGWVDQVVFTPDDPRTPTITSPTAANGFLGQAGSIYQITATSTAPAAPIRYAATGLPSGLVANPDTGVITGNPGAAGVFLLEVTATNQYGVGREMVTLAIGTVALPAALDATSLAWMPGGDSSWYGQLTESHDGADSGQSGPMNNNNACWIDTTVTGPGVLTFWWKVSSEQNYDYLRFMLGPDASSLAEVPEALGISGTTGTWTQVSVPVPPGQQVLRWQYSKDISVSDGSDAGWVDQVEYVPADPRSPVITSAPSTSGYLGQPGPYYQITASSTVPSSPITYSATGLPSGLLVNLTTGAIEGTPAFLGTYDMIVTATNQFGTGNARVALTVGATTLPVALDTDSGSLVWTTGGDGRTPNWFGQKTTTHDGVDAAQCGHISHNQAAWIETTVSGPGELRFWWKVSSEYPYDFLRFQVDGAETADAPAISGESDWDQRTVQIPAGTHTLHWEFGKDYIDTEPVGQDTAWVDQVTFNSVAPPRQIITPLVAPINEDQYPAGGPNPLVVSYTIAPDSAALVITATSNNQLLVPDSLIGIGGSSGSRSITIRTAADRSGLARITITATEPGQSTTGYFDLQVNAVNDPPTCSAISDVHVQKGSASLAIPFSVGDVDNAVNSLSVSASLVSSTPANVVTGLTVTGSDFVRSVNLTPSASVTGNATIRVTVSDGIALPPTTVQFTVYVDPVDAAPYFLPVVTGQPIVSDQTIQENTSTPALEFLVADAETAEADLRVDAVSNNQAVVPDANIQLGRNGGRRTVRVTPSANKATGYPGTSSPVFITLRVSDGSLARPPTTSTFKLTVLPVNSPPTISAIPATTTNEDTPVIVFFSIADDDLAPTALKVTATSSNPALLIGNGNLTPYVGGGAIPGNPNLFYLTLTPQPNQNGFTDITVTVTDYDYYVQGQQDQAGTALSAQSVFRLTVAPVNDAPTIVVDAADKTIARTDIQEDSSWVGHITIGDLETPVDKLVLAATSLNQGLIPNGNIVFSGTGNRRTVTITPAPDASGDHSFVTLTVSDGTTTSSDTFEIYVEQVADVPRINPVAGVAGSNPIANQTTNEDTPVTVPFTVFDPDKPTDFRSFTITCIGSDNPTLIPSTNVVIDNNPENRPNGDYTANRALTITPALNQTGSSVVTVRVDVGGGRFKDSSFTVTVTPVNDPPFFSGTIGDQTINEDSVLGPLTVAIGDADSAVSAITLTASSSNQVLVPNSNITLGGSGPNRTVTITPRLNQFGTITDVNDAVITLTATDDYAGSSGPGQTSISFHLKVAPVNDKPTISQIQPVFINEDAGEQILTFTVDDVETPPGNLVVTATTSDATLIPPASISVGGTGGNRTVRFTPGANQFGTATITVKVSDGTTADDVTMPIIVMVAAVNDAPTISGISSPTTSEGIATSALSFTVGDQETPAASLLLSVNSGNATLVPPGNVVFGGSGTNRTVTVTPAPNQSGTATITVKVTDLGAAGTGPLSATTSFVVTVNAVNDPPTISSIPAQTIVESSSTAVIPFTVGDLESPATSLVVTGSSNNTTLVPNSAANIIFGPGAGTNRTVTITPTTGEFGSATITLTVTDPGGQSTTTSFTLTVANNEWFTDASVTLGTNGTVRAIAYQADGKAVIGGAFTTVGGTPRNRIARINADGTLDLSFNPGGVGADFTVTALALDASQNILVGGEFSRVGETTGTNRKYLARLSATGNIDTSFSPNTDGFVRTIVVQPDGQILVGGEFTSIGGQSRSYLARLNPSNGSAETAFVPNPNGAVRTVLLQSDGKIVVGGAFSTIAGSARNCIGRLMSGGTIDSSFINPNAAGSGADVRCLGIQSNGSIILGGAFTTLGGASHPYVGRLDSSGNVDASFTAAAGLTVHCLRVQPDDRIVLGGDFITLNGQSRNYIGMLRSTGSLEGRFNPQGGVPFRSGADSTVYALALQPDLRLWVGGAFSFLGGQARNFIGRLDHGSGPTVSDIPDQTVAEGGTTGALSFTVGDAQTPAGSITVTASSGNTSLVPNANIVLAGNTASRTITITPAANQFGTAVITVKASDGTVMSDGNPLTASDSFLVTVTPVNSAPTISHVFANPTINEDSSTGALAFSVGDAPFETPAGSLTVSATSADTSLIPNANILLAGSGANRTINVVPAPDRTGSALITLTVSDGTAVNTDSFVVTVNAVNDLPTISHIPNQSVNEEGSTGPLSFTVGDVETPLSLLVSGTSSNTTLVPNGNIAISPSGTSRTVTVTPASNQFGTTVITLTVNDGSASASDAFVLTVNPLNDAPVISHSFVNPTINEDTPTGALPFTVGDVETAPGSLTVTAASTNLTVVPLSGITFGGSGAARTVQVTPAANQFGTATITLTVGDGALTASDSFDVTVTAVNDAPTISPHIANRTINEDSNTGAIAFTIADVETAVGSLQLTATSSHTTLVPNGNIVFGTGSGGNRQVTVTPAANQTGFTDITVTVSDGTASSSDTFRLTVSPVNDPPTITHTIANQTINEDGVTATLPFVVDDFETPGGLTMSATSSNTSLLPVANIVFTTVGPGQNDRAVTLTPLPNQFGSSTVSIIVSDGTLTASHTFVFNVLPVNDAPTIGPIADTSIYLNSTTTPPIAFTIGDVETPASNLAVTAVSADTTLIPNANLVIGGSDANRTLSITPAANQSGRTKVTITVTDIDQNPNSGGPKSSVPREFFVTVQAPEIVIEEPAGTNFPDGGSRVFGIVADPYSKDMVFTIKNTGNTVLSGINATFDGPDASLFSITQVDGTAASALPAVIVPGGSKTFTVKFWPTSAGAKTAAMHIASNDVDENPFDINLTGTGVLRGNAADLSSLVLSSGALTPAFAPGIFDYSVSVPFSTTTMTVTPTALVPTATIRVNGSPVISGQPCTPVNLAIGPTTITADVLSEDAVTTKRYSVVVNRSSGVDSKAQITSPANGSRLTSQRLDLTWNTGTGVSSYYLFVGTTAGGYDILNENQGTNRARTVTVPVDRRIHVSLFSKMQATGLYLANYYVYDPMPSAKAVLLSPVDGSTTGSTITFSWSAGVGVSRYYLWLGSSPGSSDLGVRDAGTSLSATFTGVVTDGGPIYLTLYSLINGTYVSNLYSFITQQGGGSRGAVLTSHVNGSTLPSATINLAWDSGVGVSSYHLWIGSTPNGYDLANVPLGSSLSTSVAIPGDGRRIYLTLHSLIGAAYQSNAYWFIAPTLPDGGAARVTSPANGSTLADANLSLNWSTSAGATQYYLFVGASPGASDIYAGSQGLNTSAVLTGKMPLDGRPVYVTLYSLINNAWKTSSTWYTTANTVSGNKRALISSPANDSALGSSTVTFTWGDGVGVTSPGYALWVGSSPGGYDLSPGVYSPGTNTAALNLPIDGRKIYVTLYSWVNNSWQGASYVYSTSDPVKSVVTSPVPGSILPYPNPPPPANTKATATFNWSQSEAATAYYLMIGRTPGGYDVYARSEGRGLGDTVATLPADGGPVYVTIYSYIKGAWQTSEAIYQSATP